MGCFDRVYLKCPHCGDPVEFQSKAGDCSMRDIPRDEVPTEIAKSIAGDIQRCHRCAKWAKAVILPRQILTVEMGTEKAKKP